MVDENDGSQGQSTQEDADRPAGSETQIVLPSMSVEGRNRALCGGTLCQLRRLRQAAVY